MHLIQTFKWIHPLDIASTILGQYQQSAFFYSGQQRSYSGSMSIIAIDKKQSITGNDIALLSEHLTDNQHVFSNAWFGYFAYNFRHSLEHYPKAKEIPKTKGSSFSFPPIHFTQYRTLIIFDHIQQSVTLWSENEDNIVLCRLLDGTISPEDNSNIATPHIASLSSNMTKSEYLDKVSFIKGEIARGTLSQANLTRKFYGTFSDRPDIHQIIRLFVSLCRISPSPYSSLICDEGRYILSSSPEQFIRIQNNTACTRPIKGTAPRCNNPQQDISSYNNLLYSTKDRAENLMIVDLMRNDFSRSCEVGSVRVENLFKVSSHASVHHMSSTILGKKRSDISTLSFITHCFPPGSMTGTPKIKAIELSTQLEEDERGVYSGIIGWFGGDGGFDSSVVIRTLLIEESQSEFQVGGAIVDDSTPEAEWQETIMKARDICMLLNIPLQQLETL